MPFFSVIVPVYKTERYLAECIDSVVNQRFSDWELLLVDDASPDSCPEICDSYASKDNRIKAIHLAENIRTGGVRNAGIREAAGDYLLFLDSDDWVADGSFQKVYEALRVNPSAEVTLLGWVYFYKDRNPQYSRPIIIDPAEYEGLQAFNFVERMFNSDHYTPHVGNKAIKRSFLVDNGLLFPENCHCEDPDWAFDLFRAASYFAVCEGEHYVYREREDSASRSPEFSYDRVNDHWRYIKKWSDICKDKRHPTDSLYLPVLAYQYSIFLGTLNGAPREQRDRLWTQAREYKWLLSYANDKKTTLAATACKILGLRLTSKLLSLFIRLKQAGL